MFRYRFTRLADPVAPEWKRYWTSPPEANGEQPRLLPGEGGTEPLSIATQLLAQPDAVAIASVIFTENPTFPRLSARLVPELSDSETLLAWRADDVRQPILDLVRIAEAIASGEVTVSTHVPDPVREDVGPRPGERTPPGPIR